MFGFSLCSILNFQYITNALTFLCEYLFIALHTFFESIASIRRTRKEKKHCSYKRRQAYVQYIIAYNKGLRRLSISLEKCLSVDEISIQTLLMSNVIIYESFKEQLICQGNEEMLHLCKLAFQVHGPI